MLISIKSPWSFVLIYNMFERLTPLNSYKSINGELLVNTHIFLSGDINVYTYLQKLLVGKPLSEHSAQDWLKTICLCWSAFIGHNHHLSTKIECTQTVWWKDNLRERERSKWNLVVWHPRLQLKMSIDFSINGLRCLNFRKPFE